MCLFVLAPALLFGQTAILQEEQDFRFAEQLSEKGMDDMAALQFERFVENYPASLRAPEALFNAANSYQKIDSLAKAADLYLALLFKFPRSPIVDQALYNRASLLAETGDAETAAVSFDRIKLIAPSSELVPLAQLQAGRQFTRAGQLQKALDALYFILEDYPTHPLRFETRYEIARIRKEQGKIDLALGELNKLSGERISDEFFVNAALLKAELFDLTGQQTRADSVLWQVVQSPVENDSVAAAAYKLGYHLQVVGDYAGCNEAVKKTIEKNISNEWRARLGMLQGDNYYLQGKYQEASRAYESVRYRQIPAKLRMRAAYRRAFAMQKLDRKEAAIELLESALAEMDSLNDESVSVIKPDIIIQTATMLAEDGRPLKAVELLRQNLPKVDRPRQDQLLLAMAKLQEEKLSDYAAASRAYSTLLTLFPNSPHIDEAQFGIARCAEMSGDPEEAVAEYRRFLTNYPGADNYQNATSRYDYLRKFGPPTPQAAGEALNAFLTVNISGNLDASALLKWADVQFDVFHDYQKALLFLKRVLVAEGNERVDKPYVLHRISSAHRLLAEKAQKNGNAELASAHLDSAGTSALILKRSFSKTPWAYISNLEFLDWDLAQYHSSVERITHLDSLARSIPEGAGLDTLRQELELKLAGEIINSGQESPVYQLWDRAHRITLGVIEKAKSRRLRGKALLLGAYINQQIAKTDTAVVLLEKYIDENPDAANAAEMTFRLADLYQHNGELAKAASYFKLVKEKYFYSPYSGEAVNRLARILILLGRPGEARKLLEESIPTMPEKEERLFFNSFSNADAHWIWTRTFLVEDDKPAASKALQDFLQKNPDSQYRGPALLDLADLAHRSFKDHVALGYYEELVRTGDDSLAQVAMVKAADIYYDNGQYRNAADMYGELQNQVKGELLNHVSLREAMCEYKLGNGNKAEGLAQSYWNKFKDRNGQAQLLYEEGMYHLGRKSFKNAEKVFETLRDKYKDVPEGPRGELGLARLYVILNKTDDALNALTNITTKYNNPEIVATAYLNLADFYYENRQVENCIFAARKVLDLVQVGPVRAQAMDLLITSYDDFRMYDRAIALQREYLELYPGVKNRLNRQIKIGVLLYNMKEYDRAIAHLRDLKPLADAESEPEIQYWIAKCYADRGDTEKSIIEYLKVKFLSKPTRLPWGDTALYEAGLGYKKIGNFDKAIELLQQVVRERGATDQIGRFANQQIQEIKSLKENS